MKTNNSYDEVPVEEEFLPLFSFSQKITWCYDGSEIISNPNTIRLGEVHYVPFWYFDGHIDESNSGGKGEWSYEAWTQGEFSLCIGKMILGVFYLYIHGLI